MICKLNLFGTSASAWRETLLNRRNVSLSNETFLPEVKSGGKRLRETNVVCSISYTVVRALGRKNEDIVAPVWLKPDSLKIQIKWM